MPSLIDIVLPPIVFPKAGAIPALTPEQEKDLIKDPSWKADGWDSNGHKDNKWEVNAQTAGRETFT